MTPDETRANADGCFQIPQLANVVNVYDGDGGPFWYSGGVVFDNGANGWLSRLGRFSIPDNLGSRDHEVR